MTAITYRPASPPMRSAARADPSARMSPNPSRSSVRSSMATIASALPQRSSMPPVSAVVISPRSKHSMAKAIVAPAEIVSTPYSLHSWQA